MESILENPIIIAGISIRVNDLEHASSEIGNLWERFFEDDISEKIPKRANNTIYSIYHDYEGDYSNPYTITIGHKINRVEDAPTELEVITIPSQKYKVFTSQGKMPESIVDTWGNIWDSKINRSYTFDFERYDERAHDPEDAIVDIYIALK
jgi:predicted transcriptional regulator YdeE